MPATLTVHQRSLVALRRAMRAEADGRALRRDLTKMIREALKPAVDDARSAIMEMQSGGLPVEGEPLRQAIASRIAAQARLGGRNPGASVRVRRRGMPRGFEFAARRTNRQQWRHRVFGRDVWVEQTGKPKWFDDAMKSHHKDARQAVLDAMEAMAKRIVDRVKGPA